MNSDRQTALNRACEEGHVDVVLLLELLQVFTDSRLEVIFNMLMESPYFVIDDFALGDAVGKA